MSTYKNPHYLAAKEVAQTIQKGMMRRARVNDKPSVLWGANVQDKKAVIWKKDEHDEARAEGILRKDGNLMIENKMWFFILC